ncbi:hypothetical protein, partial [Stenotrophomonas maltophilia]|uniref:hypothetical protein n=1 Tax=Stenotrophomonas maltophilia TaxID=40324 RepID=UPI001954183F
MLPVDHEKAILVGRVLTEAGPSPVLLRGGRIHDVSASAATVADLLDLADPAGVAGVDIGAVADIGSDNG